MQIYWISCLWLLALSVPRPMAWLSQSWPCYSATSSILSAPPITATWFIKFHRYPTMTTESGWIGWKLESPKKWNSVSWSWTACFQESSMVKVNSHCNFFLSFYHRVLLLDHYWAETSSPIENPISKSTFKPRNWILWHWNLNGTSHWLDVWRCYYHPRRSMWKGYLFLSSFFFFGSWIVEGNAKNYFIDEWNKGNWSWFHGYSFSMCKWIFFAKYYYEPFQLFVFLPSVLELICVNCLIKGY